MLARVAIVAFVGAVIVPALVGVLGLIVVVLGGVLLLALVVLGRVFLLGWLADRVMRIIRAGAGIVRFRVRLGFRLRVGVGVLLVGLVGLVRGPVIARIGRHSHERVAIPRGRETWRTRERRLRSLRRPASSRA